MSQQNTPEKILHNYKIFPPFSLKFLAIIALRQHASNKRKNIGRMLVNTSTSELASIPLCIVFYQIEIKAVENWHKNYWKKKHKWETSKHAIFIPISSFLNLLPLIPFFYIPHAVSSIKKIHSTLTKRKTPPRLTPFLTSLSKHRKKLFNVR